MVDSENPEKSITTIKRESKRVPRWVLPVGVLFVLVVWLITYYRIRPWTLEQDAQFGDSFGAVNALFSGLAFAFLIYTIYQQHIEYKLQRREFKLQRKAIQAQQKDIELQGGYLKLQADNFSRQLDLFEEQITLNRSRDMPRFTVFDSESEVHESNPTKSPADSPFHYHIKFQNIGAECEVFDFRWEPDDEVINTDSNPRIVKTGGTFELTAYSKTFSKTLIVSYRYNALGKQFTDYWRCQTESMNLDVESGRHSASLTLRRVFGEPVPMELE